MTGTQTAEFRRKLRLVPLNNKPKRALKGNYENGDGRAKKTKTQEERNKEKGGITRNRKIKSSLISPIRDVGNRVCANG